MAQIKRREFIKQTGFATVAVAGAGLFSFDKPNKNQKLSFSTIGCPKWDLPTMVNFAAGHDYQGIEIRIIASELDLPKYPDFSVANIAATKRMIADKNIAISDVGCSAEMHHSDKFAQQKNLDDAKRFIDLASKLGSKYVRVFPEKFLQGNEKQKSLDTIIENLTILGNFAKGSNVKVLIESHGDLVYMNDLDYVMRHSANSDVGMVWDIFNMWSVTKQPPTEAFGKLKNYISHVHIKDAVWVNGKEQYVLLGKGVAPIREAIKNLREANYDGFYSFEWEKLWHPELEEPEIALASFPTEVRKYFGITTR